MTDKQEKELTNWLEQELLGFCSDSRRAKKHYKREDAGDFLKTVYAKAILAKVKAHYEPLIKKAFNEGVKKTTDACDSTFSTLLEEARKQEKWVDMPDKRGDYWVSPLIDGKYISPRIISVIDFDRPDRGIEVEYEFSHTIPVKTFCKEYYPKAKWMFIPEPAWQALSKEGGK